MSVQSSRLVLGTNLDSQGIALEWGSTAEAKKLTRLAKDVRIGDKVYTVNLNSAINWLARTVTQSENPGVATTQAIKEAITQPGVNLGAVLQNRAIAHNLSVATGRSLFSAEEAVELFKEDVRLKAERTFAKQREDLNREQNELEEELKPDLQVEGLNIKEALDMIRGEVRVAGKQFAEAAAKKAEFFSKANVCDQVYREAHRAIDKKRINKQIQDEKKENAAATVIQRFTRGHLARKELAQKNAAATVIQRFFRGHIVRKQMAESAQANAAAAAADAEPTTPQVSKLADIAFLAGAVALGVITATAYLAVVVPVALATLHYYNQM